MKGYVCHSTVELGVMGGHGEMSHRYSSGGAVLEKENLYTSLELALQESGSAQAEKQMQAQQCRRLDCRRQ